MTRTRELSIRINCGIRKVKDPEVRIWYVNWKVYKRGITYG